MTSDSLSVVREPVDWLLGYGPPGCRESIAEQLYGGAWACGDLSWTPPRWLMEHQYVSAIRVAGTLQLFTGAILADAVGLGKTYIALAVATRYRKVVVSVPATLRGQWLAAAAAVRVDVSVVSHESLSRGATLPTGDLLIVDEAHWFRNPTTVRYDTLARGIGTARVLLVTATPVVNSPADLVHLLRLFLPDNGLRVTGLPSLANAADLNRLADAASVVTIAGNDRLAPAYLPAVRDISVRRATLDPDNEGKALELIGKLTFPNFGGSDAGHLLRKHMLLRLASSVEALRDTARGHLAYLRAVRTNPSRDGATRRALQEICSRDDCQLDFLSRLSGSHQPPRNLRLLRQEEDLLGSLLQLIAANQSDPKRDRLRDILLTGRPRNTLVFTGAAVTARGLATAFDWRYTAVATGRGCFIASGRIDLDDALDCFSPRSRGVPGPVPSLRIATLIATDLASEGLNLQDADSLVHYDLPWNPMRLQQRLGRIRRIGSQHRDVSVTWFLPSDGLERALGLPQLIDRKSREQVQLGVATTAVVGTSLQYNELQEQRQFLCARGRPVNGTVGHVVVGGTGAAVCLRWQFGARCIFETVAITPDGITKDPFVVGPTIAKLACSEIVPDPVPEPVRRHIIQHVRRRIRLIQRSPPVHHRLRRKAMALARLAARNRNHDLVDKLDRVLDALQHGVAVGQERAIADWLDGQCDYSGLALDSLPFGAPEFHNVTITAGLFGSKFSQDLV